MAMGMKVSEYRESCPKVSTIISWDLSKTRQIKRICMLMEIR